MGDVQHTPSQHSSISHRTGLPFVKSERGGDEKPGGEAQGLEAAQAGPGAAEEGSHTKGRPVLTPAGRQGADRDSGTTDRGPSLAGSGQALLIKASGAVTGDGLGCRGEGSCCGLGWGQGRVEVGHLSLLLCVCMFKPGQ